MHVKKMKGNLGIVVVEYYSRISP